MGAASSIIYEIEKESTLQTLEDKEIKLNEIDIVLIDEILTTLEKLMKEYVQYVQWTNRNTKVDKVERFCI